MTACASGSSNRSIAAASSARAAAAENAGTIGPAPRPPCETCAAASARRARRRGAAASAGRARDPRGNRGGDRPTSGPARGARSGAPTRAAALGSRPSACSTRRFSASCSACTQDYTGAGQDLTRCRGYRYGGAVTVQDLHKEEHEDGPLAILVVSALMTAGSTPAATTKKAAAPQKKSSRPPSPRASSRRSSSSSSGRARGSTVQPGPSTVFAPTDAAFAKVPKATLAALAKNKAALKAVLLYHVVKGKAHGGAGVDAHVGADAGGRDAVPTSRAGRCTSEARGSSRPTSWRRTASST